MRLVLTKSFIRRFESLAEKERQRVRKALDEISSSPWAGKKLSGSLEGERSWRVGDYRILYMIEGDRIIAEAVGHRREIYR